MILMLPTIAGATNAGATIAGATIAGVTIQNAEHFARTVLQILTTNSYTYTFASRQN
jgi:hypothetical protein